MDTVNKKQQRAVVDFEEFPSPTLYPFVSNFLKLFITIIKINHNQPYFLKEVHLKMFLLPYVTSGTAMKVCNEVDFSCELIQSRVTEALLNGDGIKD